MNPSFLVALQGAAMVSVVAGATCYDHLIIDTRGTGELQGTSIGLAAIIDQVKESVPNVGVHDTIYPAAPDVTQLTTLVGAYDIEQTIQQGLKDCPNQLYSLLGATVTNEVPQKYEPTSVEGQAIEAVLLIGNPYHQPLKQGNRDGDCGNSTAGATGALVGLGLDIPDAWYETGKFRDICFSDDLVCNGINAGDLFKPNHLLYGFTPSVIECGSSFLIDQMES
ncbi:hypothetical protein KC343_g13804 [Hortaea werneckii]|uniref:Cutinase n=1 Tax=Hortaea werneckii TaxID=91943 RepID=A0A3M7HCR1_HORWE|nr:hypothetical protein KC352_g33998 [Hortaea werneckii]KAI7550535.1 hypothetical protein KC317_g14241 [Hortaea werneckii]KAI7598806.1 hypothetical protein KC346_g14055 [Hortaea werneckii]KAI7605247.1 hypothetical protein KC343_g13804 [Hortaea werneckii]KAI7641221.1 hypothetical protein KC319_g13599 [Hortaea werneckii]